VLADVQEREYIQVCALIRCGLGIGVCTGRRKHLGMYRAADAFDGHWTGQVGERGRAGERC
jgi:hypothetical protein